MIAALTAVSKVLSPINLGEIVPLVHSSVLELAERIVDRQDDPIELLDEISNTLCSVLDPVSCIRLVSENPRLVQEAEKAADLLEPLVRSINGDRQLYSALNKFLEANQIECSEKRAIGRHFLEDFKLFGMHLPGFEKVKRLHKEHVEMVSLLNGDFHRKGCTSTQKYELLLKTRKQLASSLGYSRYFDLHSFKRSLSASSVEVLLKTYLDRKPTEVSLCISTMAPSKRWRSYDSVLPRILQLSAGLFGFSFNIKAHSKNIQLIEIIDESGPCGGIFVDTSRKKHVHPCHFNLLGSKMNVRHSPLLIGQQHSVTYIYTSLADRDRLSLEEISSLAHELGHAFHSVFSRTKYQNLSGTRCSMEFSEFPSMLLQKLFSSWSALRALGAPEGERRAFEEWVEGRRDNRHDQVKIAWADLELHTRTESTAEACLRAGELDRNVSQSPVYKNWVGHVEHFITYGSFYYSYPLADLLADAALQRIGSDRIFAPALRRLLLSKGGTVDPIKTLRSLGLDFDFLKF